MKKSSNQFAMVWWIVAVSVLISQSQTAKAGWSGGVNGVNFGYASANVISSTGHSNTIKTAFMTAPGAAMTTTAGYSLGAPLPLGSSLGTFARVKGTAGYVMTASATNFNGDHADNPSIDKLIDINPSECAGLEMDSSPTIDPDGKSGIIVVNTSATAGTALLLRGFEYDDPTPPTSLDDLETNVNSHLKWHILLVGPFNLNTSNCTAVTIPFTIDTSVTNLYFVSDGEAKSLPLQVFCPSNIVVNCGDPVVYGEASYSGCGNITATYNPPQGYSFPVGVTTVTLTIANQFGDSSSCNFTVTVMDRSTPATPVLSNLVYTVCPGTGITPPVPTTTDSCAGNISGTTTTAFPITALGTTTVTWTFTNPNNGHTATATQSVTLVDTAVPVTPVLSSLTFNTCSGGSVTPPTPTTTDVCGGTIPGTTTTQFPLTALGTTVVTWTFTDPNSGKSTTATQNVTLTGLTFSGFASPIGGINGTCSNPLRVINDGSNIPIKFDLACGSTPITSGTPPVVIIQSYNKNCSPGTDLVNVNAVYQNSWHYNWDTSGWAKGIYKVIVVLPDGTSQYAFVQLK